MSEWAAKRFWKAAEVVPQDGGFAVLLDGRPVKTPAKTALVVPTRAMAREIAAEWDAQEDIIDPLSMPFTRSANAALDKVRLQRAEVADMLAAYGDSDLLCYRADHPEELVARQAAAWDPLLDWAAERFGARLEPRTGVIHSPQDAAALAMLSDEVHKMTAFQLAGLHDLVGISGSLVLALAVADGHLQGQQAWALSRIDETWQAEQWGADEEASVVASRKQEEFLHATRFYHQSS